LSACQRYQAAKTAVKTCVGLKSAYKASGCTFVFQPLDGRLPDSHCLMHACRQQQFVLLVTVRKMRLDQLCVLTVKHANRNGSPIFVVKQIVSMTTVVNEAMSVSSKYGSTRSRPAPSPALRADESASESSDRRSHGQEALDGGRTLREVKPCSP